MTGDKNNNTFLCHADINVYFLEQVAEEEGHKGAAPPHNNAAVSPTQVSKNDK